MLPQLTVGSEGRVKILGPSYLILDEFECILVLRILEGGRMKWLLWIGLEWNIPTAVSKERPFHSFQGFFIRSVILLLFNEAI